MLTNLNLSTNSIDQLVTMAKFMTKKRWGLLAIVALAGFILGRLAFRVFLNLLLGGTLFGGNLL